MNTIEHQQDFPTNDLTDKNTSALRDLFRQPHMLYVAGSENPDGHLDDQMLRYSLTPVDASTIKSRELYQQVEAILRPLHNQMTTAEQLDFAYGYTLDELITSLVAAKDFLSVDPPATVALQSLQLAILGKSLQQFRTESMEQFQDEQPRVTRLVAESAAKQHAQSVPSALLGAAVKRQIELDTREYGKSLVQ